MAELAVILLAEDREDDVLLIRRAFKEAHITNPLFVVRDGKEAIAYLSGVDQYANRVEYPLPILLLLDLKMPRLDGFDVLRWLRNQEGLKTLRVIVLTSSDSMRDLNEAHTLGANSFLVKPFDFEDAVRMTKSMAHYWLELSRAPATSRPAVPKQAQANRPSDFKS